jgi:hypothetical protein
MTSTWQPYREPLRATLIRTGAIAAILGAVLAGTRGGGLARWPAATLLALWPSLGGHFVELFFLNWLKPRIPRARSAQILSRIGVWFIGGVVLAMGMRFTAVALGMPGARLSWWIGGIGLVGIELVVHFVLLLRGASNFYDGRGPDFHAR